jgi:hypothetical protein
MPRYLLLAYTAPEPGVAEVGGVQIIGVTPNTTMTPLQIAESFAGQSTFQSPMRLFVMSSTGSEAFDQTPEGPPTPAPIDTVPVAGADAIDDFPTFTP